MKLVAWIAKLGFFLLVLWFALKNTTPVPVRFTADLVLDGVIVLSPRAGWCCGSPSSP